jgi:hypothetical protein
MKRVALRSLRDAKQEGMPWPNLGVTERGQRDIDAGEPGAAGGK